MSRGVGMMVGGDGGAHHGRIENTTTTFGAVKVGGWRYEDSTRYIGEWDQRGQKHGTGHLQFPDGTRFDGQFYDGLSHGLGCLWFSDGAK